MLVGIVLRILIISADLIGVFAPNMIFYQTFKLQKFMT
jgi:hypothetical protein